MKKKEVTFIIIDWKEVSVRITVEIIYVIKHLTYIITYVSLHKILNLETWSLQKIITNLCAIIIVIYSLIVGQDEKMWKTWRVYYVYKNKSYHVSLLETSTKINKYTLNTFQIDW